MSAMARGTVIAAIVVLTAVGLAVTESRPDRPVYRELLERLAAHKGLDPDLVDAVVHAESGRRAAVVSPKGAVGLMQLMPATAREVGVWIGMEEVSDAMLRDPEVNLRLGVEYLGWLVDRFGSLELALAAYNAGPGRVGEWRRDHPELPPDRLVEEVAFEETRNFVSRVLHRYAENRLAKTRWAENRRAGGPGQEPAPLP